jgi:prephenate dehydrogenase
MHTDYGFLSKSRILILGLGLMGGSLAMALRGHCERIFAYDPDEDVIQFARDIQAIDEGSTSLEEFFGKANIIILAAPVKQIILLVKQLSRIQDGNPVVIDLGSTKTEIVKVMDELPERFQPIGGHPMCGKEKSSIHHSEPDLFKGSVFLLTPLERTTTVALETATQMIRLVGATPLLLDPVTHDRLTAATSHFPYLMANILAQITSLDAQFVLGPGFRSTSRLAGSSPDMMLDILATNRENILPLIDRFSIQLEKIKKSLEEENYADLLNDLRSGAENYQKLTG